MNERVAQRNKIRLDEVSKSVVRRLFRLEKKRFIKQVKSTHYGSLPNTEKTQELLVQHLAEKYHLKREILEREEELIVAKSIFYNFSARRQDDSLGSSDIEKMKKTRVRFCESGTRKEAMRFFSS